MAGDIDNTSVWDDADVFVSFDLEATLPTDADDEFGVAWERIGFLDGAAGFVDTLNQSTKYYSVWGAGAIKQSVKVNERTVAFTAHERNETTDRLARPGKVPVLLALETRENDRVYRRISRLPANVMRNGAITDAEETLTAIPLMAFVVPDTDIDVEVADQYFIEQDSAATGS
jgi:hypothetical protein